MNNKWNIPKTLTLTKEPKKTHTMPKKTNVSKTANTHKQQKYLEHTRVAIGSRTLPHSLSLYLNSDTHTNTERVFIKVV